MTQKRFTVLKIILIAVLAATLIWTGVIFVQRAESKTEYDEAQELFEQVEAPIVQPAEGAAEQPIATPKPTPKPTDVTYTDPYIEALSKLDISPLKAENEDVIGWIKIPDTIISYPIIQGEDNDFYLKHSWKKTKSSAGAIFMEHQNSGDFSDFNTIIYGHNMKSDSMFGTLGDYCDYEYWQAHPYVYIVNDAGVFRYDIFAAQQVRLNTVVYGMKIENHGQREEIISYSKDYSEIDTDIEPTVYDKILTLSTCSGGRQTRWIVQAVLNEQECFIRER